MTVSAVVVSHGHAAELERSLVALAPQVDEIVVICEPAGLGRSGAARRARAREPPAALPRRQRQHGASPPRRAPTSSFRIRTRFPPPSAVAELAAIMDEHPRCGIAGPQMLWPDGTWQPSRRRFPTVSGTIVRRTPLRRLAPPYERQREHYLLDERPTEPVEADWMLGAFLLQRRSMLDEIGGWDAGYRHYVEDIDLCYRAMRAGWERWYVPAAVVHHAYAAVIDHRFLSRHTLWHLRGMARFARKHPEALPGSR